MVHANPHFHSLKREYIFPKIEKHLETLKSKPHTLAVLNLGIGDISLPLAPSIAKAICLAIEEMTKADTIKGYGPSDGYPFLKTAISKGAYQSKILPEEIFISDGINTDIVNILNLFHPNSRVALPDPAYPAYLDSNLLCGRRKIISMPCTEETGFVPSLPDEEVDLIYLCSPHNPTGEAMSYQELEAFVSYAKRKNAVILYDNAYEAFITSPSIPKSIYEIEGAKEVALEFRSFSKSAGFTGLRCSYVVVPNSLKVTFEDGTCSLQTLWSKRQSIAYNGVAYPIQKGAECCFSSEGEKEIGIQIHSYTAQAKAIREGLLQMGHTCYGGLNSPYVWWKTPKGIPSWEFFALLLDQQRVITIPGQGFGKHGEGYMRISGFVGADTTQEFLNRVKNLIL